MIKRNKKILKLLLYIAGAYILLMIGIIQLQKKLIFRPDVLPADFPYSFKFNFEEFNIKTADGATLNALYIKVPHPKGAILYFHGNKGSLERWGNIAGHFTSYGYNVLVMDYRGYGKSTGYFTERLLQNDARLFYTELKKKFNEDSIIIYGRSLGSHFATLVASENKPKRLILETPFSSMADVAQSKFPIFPVKLFLQFPLDNIALIKNVNIPITIFHGTADRVVPYRLGKKLFDAAKANKILFTIPGGSHNNLSDYEIYRTAIKKILSDL